jgi:hypothetical protein
MILFRKVKMTTLALVNIETNICENVTLDDRPASEIQVPGFLVLDLITTPSRAWSFNKDSNSYEAVDAVGEGGIDCTWDGTRLIHPKPSVE